MNLDSDLLRALALNLGHVSRQRTRYIQMELRRFATDSRMKNERNFWTILENNGLRFPQRTANSFLSLIKDQRGINVETAVKYIKESQKRTRRDSVEAMVEGEIKAENRDKRSKEKSNYSAYKKMTKRMSLDEFRRLGRMVANVSTITGRARDQKLYESIAGEDSANVEDEDKEEKDRNTVDSEEKEGDQNEAVTDTTNETILEILMNTSEFDSTEKEISKPGDKNLVPQLETDEQPKIDYLSVPVPEKKSLPTDFDPFVGMDKEEKNVTEITISSKKKKKSKHKAPPCAIVITIEDTDAEPQPIDVIEPQEPEKTSEVDDINEDSKVSFYMGSNDGSETDLKQNQIDENKDTGDDRFRDNDDLQDKFNLNLSFDETVETQQNEEVAKTDDNVNESLQGVRQETEEHQNEVVIKIESSPEISNDESDHEIDQNTQINDFAQNTKNYYTTNDDEQNNENTDKADRNENDKDRPQTTFDAEISTENEHVLGEQQENNEKQTKKEEKVECLGESDDYEEETKLLTNKEHDKETSQNEEILEDSTNEHQEPVSLNNTDSENGSSSAFTQNEDAQSNNSENLEKHVPEGQATSHEKESATDELQDDDEVKKSESDSKTLDHNSEEDKLSDHSTDSFVTDDLSEARVSEVQSSSCEEDADDKKETEFDTQSIADYGGEIVDVGGFEITMFPPEWQKDKEYTNTVENLATSSEPKLELDWVYCCQISHAQSLASLGDDEIIYGSGCVVVLYNHIRKSQRHYMGHSGPISCVSVHPDQNIVGSAQSESTTAENMIDTVSETLKDSAKIAPNHGRIHIRVWDSVDLNTLYVMGVGTLQSSVRKMQFMNYKSYILTIEDDEAASLTLWDGGCKLKRMATIVSSNEELMEAETKSKRKNLSSKYVRKIDNSPRGLAASSTNSADFAIAGREHLGFWKIKDIDDYTSETADEDFVQITGPQRGDFAQHFLPRYVTCCVKAERADEGCYITGDTNGTLLVWSESLKEVILGTKHAHECPISCVLRTKAHIFSGGATDKTINAFTWGLRELECVGSIVLPSTVGQIATISVAGANLFVGTSKNLICTVEINHPSYAIYRPKKTKNQNKAKKEKTAYNRAFEDDAILSNIFEKWENKEIARGTKNEITCVCSADNFKRRSNRNLSTPPLENQSTQRPSKSAGVRRQSLVAERPTRSARPYGNSKSNTKGASTIEGIPKLTTAFASPKLKTTERSLKRERSSNIDSAFILPQFGLENFVDKVIFTPSPFPQGTDSRHFLPQEKPECVPSSFFVAASNEGEIRIYDAIEHCCVGRMKLPTTREITCIDCFSKRSMIVLGSASGHVIVLRLNLGGFEVASENLFRSKHGNSRKILAIKFSKGGNKVALSISKEIIIATTKSTGIQEVGRCIGHLSTSITSLDWSEVTFHGSELLRSSAIIPEPEILVWSTEPIENIEDLSTVRNIKWQTNTCSLDYAAKGVWDHFTNHKENIFFSVGEVKYHSKLGPTVNEKQSSGQFLTSNFNNWRSTPDYDVPALHTTCCVGDATGCIRSYHYPTVASYPNETALRVFHSAVSSISRLPGGVIACGSMDRSIIQFSIEDEIHENTK